MSWCSDPDEERRKAREDYRRGGSYGYDRERYDRRVWDDCAREYADEFDRTRRENDDRRREDEERERRERAAYARAQQERAEENAYYEDMRKEAEQYAEPEPPMPEPAPDAPERRA